MKTPRLISCLLVFPRSTCGVCGYMCVQVGLDGGVILQQVTARGFGLRAAWATADLLDLQSDEDVTGEMSQ